MRRKSAGSWAYMATQARQVCESENERLSGHERVVHFEKEVLLAGWT